MREISEEQKRAIEIVAEMVFDTHSYDYVDDTIEIRLYDEAREIAGQVMERKWREQREASKTS